MTKIELAVTKDIQRSFFEAIELYEEIISAQFAPIDAYINLAFIYWRFGADFGFQAANNISNEWRDIGAKKYSKVISDALKLYPQSRELHFWEKYFPHRDYFSDFSSEECLAIIEKYNIDESLVPYFFLYLDNPKKYSVQRNRLLLQCEKTPTQKNVYIMALLTSNALGI
jgi:hypothetical protein